MAINKVIDAVEARLAANFTRCTVFGFNLAAESEPPQDGSAFLQVSYPAANNTQITVGDPGNNLWRENGAFRLALFARRGEGIAGARVWMAELADLFRGKKFDGVQCWGPTSPALDDRNEEGVYFILSIAVPYQADYFG